PGIELDGVGCTRADQKRSAGMCSVREGFDGRLGHDGDTLYERLGECGLAERKLGLSSAMSPLQCCNVDLGHLHHRLHDALRLHWILVLQQFDQDARNDLPGKTELVLEPAA